MHYSCCSPNSVRGPSGAGSAADLELQLVSSMREQRDAISLVRALRTPAGRRTVLFLGKVYARVPRGRAIVPVSGTNSGMLASPRHGPTGWGHFPFGQLPAVQMETTSGLGMPRSPLGPRWLIRARVYHIVGADA